MKIRLPKPDIKCHECGSKNVLFKFPRAFVSSFKKLDYCIEGLCDNCGKDFEIELVFKEDPKICNCGVCQKIKAGKNEPRN